MVNRRLPKFFCSTVVALAAAFWAVLCCAEESKQINIKINLDTASGLRVVRKSTATDEDNWMPGQSYKFQADASQSGIQEITITAEWDDDVSSTVLLNVYPELPTGEYLVILTKPVVVEGKLDSEIHRICFETAPKTLGDAFRKFQNCRAYTMFLERNRGEFYTYRHLKALNGWFLSIYKLYTAVKPVSIYAFDPDLLQRLRDLDTTIRGDGAREQQVSRIIRVADVRRALTEVETQITRIALLAVSKTADSDPERMELLKRAASGELEKFDEHKGFVTVYGTRARKLRRTLR